jgi:nucleoside-diphosphate-sugar epimerase
MAENLCYSYYAEFGVPVKIARLAQTFGAGVDQEESRVFGQFARSAVEEKDIILHTEGTTIGNYVYTADALKGLFSLLFQGLDGEAYNIVNDTASVSIKQMAELVAEEVAGNKIKVNDGNTIINIQPTGKNLTIQ